MQDKTPLRVASIADPAIDVPEMNRTPTGDTHGTLLIRYIVERRPADLRIKAGRENDVVWFTVARIATSRFRRFVNAEGDENLRRERAFQAAVVRVDNLVRVDTGTREPTFTPRSLRGGEPEAVCAWGADELEMVAPAYVEEIGQIAYTRGFLAHVTAPSFPVLPSFPATLAARGSLDAAPSPTAAVTNSDG